MTAKNDRIINNILNIPFYTNKHHYKFLDFEFDDQKSFNIVVKSKKISCENVSTYEMQSNQSELKSQNNKKISMTKTLEYFNKAQEIEKSIK